MELRSIPGTTRAAAGVRPLPRLFWLALSLWFPALAVAAAPAPEPDAAYAIQLALTDQAPRPEDLPDLRALRDYRIYVVQGESDGRPWYRLRLGFFASAREAAGVNAAVQPAFPGSWVLKVSAEERRASAATALTLAAAKAVPAAQSAPAPAVGSGTEGADPLGALMESARQAVAKGDYPLAIRIYTKVLEAPANPYLQDAQEYLGLARERNGQLAHAKAEYEKYLSLYPEGPGAERVRQRLAGLVTMRQEPPQKLPEQKRSAQAMQWRNAGAFSQFYRRDLLNVDGVGSTVTQSVLYSDLDLSAQGRSENVDVRARFNGGYAYDFQSGGENLTRLSSMYVEASERRLGVFGRLGRQTRGSGGVFERFDGALLSLQTARAGKISVVGGYPVETSDTTTVNTDKVFYGLSTDLGTLENNWGFSLYAITQEAGSLTDRQAVGGELRYFDNVRSLLGLIDYDVHFQALNIFSLLGNWTFDNQMTYNFSINQSRSPFLSASNALIGQTATKLDELLATYTEDEIRALALDRTAISRYVSAGLSRPLLNEKLQFNADLTISNLSSTPASGNVAAVAGTGNEFLYSLQLVGNSLLRTDDLAILGLLYLDGNTTRSTTVTVDTRYPVNDLWRVNPRLRVDKREFNQDSTSQLTTAPSIRLDYRRSRDLDLEIDLGAEWSSRDLAAGGTEKTSGYFLNLGYTLSF